MKLVDVLTMSLKHLPKGSAWPTLKPNTLRIYSMHFCPYAQRTRLVLAHKQIPHELINVNLKHKPDWFLARNPVGLVPVLEYNNNVVCESLVCDDFLDEIYTEHPLYPKDPYERARHKAMMIQFEKVAEAFTAIKSRNLERKERGMKTFTKKIALYEEALTETFFAGTKPGMIDYHLWPFFERIPAMESLSGVSTLPADTYPRLHNWMKAMLEVPAVKATWINDDLHKEFFISFATGEPHYDAAFQARL